MWILSENNVLFLSIAYNMRSNPIIKKTRSFLIGFFIDCSIILSVPRILRASWLHLSAPYSPLSWPLPEDGNSACGIRHIFPLSFLHRLPGLRCIASSGWTDPLPVISPVACNKIPSDWDWPGHRHPGMGRIAASLWGHLPAKSWSWLSYRRFRIRPRISSVESGGWTDGRLSIIISIFWPLRVSHWKFPSRSSGTHRHIGKTDVSCLFIRIAFTWQPGKSWWSSWLIGITLSLPGAYLLGALWAGSFIHPSSAWSRACSPLKRICSLSCLSREAVRPYWVSAL